jgi:hypothetical protein
MNYETPTQQLLLARLPGYEGLTVEERDALNDFCMIWPVIEGLILGPQYDTDDLLRVAVTLQEGGVLQADTLSAEIDYMRSRYFRDGSFTGEFHGLHLERARPEHQKVIRRFLTAKPPLSVADALQGALMIILRYRNNTFHGAKALYGYQGQLENFKTACAVLGFVLANHPLKY